MSDWLNSCMYNKIKKNIEEGWVDWKKKYANDNLLVSKNSKKLRV